MAYWVHSIFVSYTASIDLFIFASVQLQWCSSPMRGTSNIKSLRISTEPKRVGSSQNNHLNVLVSYLANHLLLCNMWGNLCTCCFLAISSYKFADVRIISFPVNNFNRVHFDIYKLWSLTEVCNLLWRYERNRNFFYINSVQVAITNVKKILDVWRIK